MCNERGDRGERTTETHTSERERVKFTFVGTVLLIICARATNDTASNGTGSEKDTLPSIEINWSAVVSAVCASVMAADTCGATMAM
jgi:hypothetical protein